MDSVLAENKRARFDYAILESYEAGIELTGQEVKSVRRGSANLQGSYAIIRGGECWLINCTIPPFQTANTEKDYEPTRTRRLLLNKKEIAEISHKLDEKGISLLALKFFVKHGLVKLEVGLGKSRKAHDKRELLKERSAIREMRQG
jgi:SsrA-binding protein